MLLHLKELGGRRVVKEHTKKVPVCLLHLKDFGCAVELSKMDPRTTLLKRADSFEDGLNCGRIRFEKELNRIYFTAQHIWCFTAWINEVNFSTQRNPPDRSATDEAVWRSGSRSLLSRRPTLSHVRGSTKRIPDRRRMDGRSDGSTSHSQMSSILRHSGFLSDNSLRPTNSRNFWIIGESSQTRVHPTIRNMYIRSSYEKLLSRTICNELNCPY